MFMLIGYFVFILAVMPCASQVVAPAQSASTSAGILGLDPGVLDAISEATLTMLAFFVAAVLIQSLKTHNQKTAASRKAAQKVPAANDASSPSLPRREPTCQVESLRQQPIADLTLDARRPNPRAGAAESDALAAAVRNGRAWNLPTLLDESYARVLHSTTDAAAGEKAAAQHLLSSLRACASRRCFKEALHAYQHVSDRIGPGCSSTWSLLLYSAVECNAWSMCRGFIAHLSQLGGLASTNDFINMVRYYVQQRDTAGLTRTVEALQQSGFQLDVLSRNRALSICTSKSAFDMAEVIVEICDTAMDTVAFNTLMKGYSQAGQPERCYEFYAKMRHAGLSPSEVSFGILLEACINAGDLDRSRHVFDELRNSGHTLNVVHYTTYMKGLANAGLLEEARGVLAEMHKSSCTKPDLVTYSTLIKAHAECGKLVEAIRVMEDMLEHGVKADSIVFNILLSGCCVKTIEPAQIFHVFKWLRAHGLQTSTATLSILLKALALSEAWQDALDLLDNAPKQLGLWPESRLYSQLAQACAKCGGAGYVVAAYESMMKSALAQGVAIDDATSARMHKLCCRCNQGSATTKIHQASACA